MLGTFLGAVNASWVNGELSAASLLRLVPFALLLASVMLWTGTWFVGVYGRWRGGRGTAKQLRMAFSWSCAPTALTALCWGPIWILNGGPMPDDPAPESVGEVTAVVLHLYTTIVGPLWATVLSVPAVAEAHRFSLWKAIDSIACVAFTVFMAMIGGLLLASWLLGL